MDRRVKMVRVDKKNETKLYTKEQIRDIFKKYDKDQNGVLSKEELKTAFRHMGSCAPKIRVCLSLYAADANGDGVISENELEDLVKYAAALGYKVK